MPRGLVVLVASAALAACHGGGRASGAGRAPILVPAPSSNPLPDPTPAPACVSGALISARKVCGLGVAGRAYHWNDPDVAAQAKRRAARNLAGMLRSVVTSAMVLEQTEGRTWTQTERYVEIDEALIDDLEARSEAEVWFDVAGTGPFGVPERTYACACLPSVEVGIRIDAEQARRHALARQYAFDEVPRWITDRAFHNDALLCAVGYVEPAFFPEDLHGYLTESVIEALARYTRTWIRTEFEERTRCRADDEGCQRRIRSLLEAANEGISRGVAVTAVWHDKRGIGPQRRPGSAYGWGCVFEATALDRARTEIEAIRRGS